MYLKIKGLHNVGQECWQNHFWVIKDKRFQQKTPALTDSGSIKSILGQETFRKALALFYALGGISGHSSE